MTALAEFERDYAARSGTTVDKLHAIGLYPAPCNCHERGCQGWQMVQAETYEKLKAKS